MVTSAVEEKAEEGRISDDSAVHSRVEDQRIMQGSGGGGIRRCACGGFTGGAVEPDSEEALDPDAAQAATTDTHVVILHRGRQADYL
jgi:hypothetical protein